MKYVMWFLFGVLATLAYQKVYACEQQTFIIDGKVIVCSSCGGVTICD